MNNDYSSAIPEGLTMALAQNIDAMRKFISMNDSEKQAVVNMTHEITSKEQMRSFVNNNFSIR